MGKRALCLSGGGAHGAIEVGVIKALTEKGISWDVVAGVSVGALNGVQLAMHPKSQHRKAALELEKLWTEDIQGNHSIYKKWAPWIFNYIPSLWKGGIYNTSPLMNIINKRFDAQKLKTSGVELRLGTVDLRTKKYYAATENDGNIPQWVMASAAMPTLFPPVKINDGVWVDGGVRTVIPLNDVLGMGVDEIDVVVTKPIDRLVGPEPGEKYKSVVNVALRSVECAMDEVYLTDLDYVKFTSCGAIKVNLYIPTYHLPYDAFDFHPEDLKKAIETGYRETLEKLSQS